MEKWISSVTRPVKIYGGQLNLGLGMNWPTSKCKKIQLEQSWEFGCHCLLFIFAA